MSTEPPAAPEPPEPPATPADASDAASDDPEAVRARLAARGMLRTEPSVRILDVTASLPRPEPAPTAETTGGPGGGDRDGFDTLLDDAETIEAEPGGPTALVRCLSCRSTQQVSLAATGYRCTTCSRVWRWAVCNACTELGVTLARQESWRCRSCGATTRSWWRTPEAPRHAVAVADRRRVEATKGRRTRVRRAIRRQRARLIAGAATALLLVAFVLIAGRIGRSADEAVADTSAATCAAFHDLAGDLAGGGLPPAAVRTRLDELAAGAAEADDPVRIGAERLAASGLPGDPTFEEAEDQLARLCPR